MRKTIYLIGFLFISLLLISKSSVRANNDNDFSEFDDFDESPPIKVDNPGLNEFEIDESLKQEEADPSLKNDPQMTEQQDNFSNEEDEEEVTIEEDEQIEDEDQIKDKKEKEKKPFEPIKLSSLPLHLR